MKSRSVSFETFSSGCPVCSAMSSSSSLRYRVISLAWISMSTAWPCAPPCGWCRRIRECGQRVALALGPREHEHRGRRGRLPHADRRDVRLDVLHRVVDREQRRDVPARRVDVQVDVLVGILGLQVQELRHDEVADGVVDRRPEEHDPLLEQARVDVERALAAAGLLDDDGNEVVLHDVSSADPSAAAASSEDPSDCCVGSSAPGSGLMSACSTRKSSAFERMISPASATT